MSATPSDTPLNISYRRKRLYFALIFSLFASMVSVVQISQAPSANAVAVTTDPCNGAQYASNATSPVTLTYVSCPNGRAWRIPDGVTTVTISVYGGAGGNGAGSIQGSTLVGSRAGTITVVATKDGDQQYGAVVSAPITFTITG